MSYFKIFRFKSLESAMISPGLTNQRNTQTQLVKIVKHLVNSSKHLKKYCMYAY